MAGGGKAAGQGAVVTDARFAAVHTDPRFARGPEQKERKVELDERFQKVFTSPEFNDLPGLAPGAGAERTAADLADPRLSMKARLDLLTAMSRGDVAMESSGDEMSDDEEGAGSAAEPEVVGDEDEGIFAVPADAPNIGADAPSIQPTRRLAMVRLDWDHINATDILATLQSFAPTGTRVERVFVIPSDYGEQKLAEERTSGPKVGNGPVRRFRLGEGDGRATAGDAEDVLAPGHSHDLATEEGVDPVELRKYEVGRLLYYYAVVEFDTVETAKAVYKACDGVEFQQSGNVMDLRYIPDDMKFDGKERTSEATEVPADYEPPHFTTSALQSTKVELTWDADDPRRSSLLRGWQQRLKTSARELRKQKKKKRSGRKGLGARGEEEEEAEEDDDPWDAAGLQEGAFKQFFGGDSDEEAGTAENDPWDAASDSGDSSDGGGDNDDEVGGGADAGGKSRAEKVAAYRRLLLGDMADTGADAEEAEEADEAEEAGAGRLGRKRARRGVGAGGDDVVEVRFEPGLASALQEKRRRREEEAEREGETSWEAFLRRKQEKKQARKELAKQRRGSRGRDRSAEAAESAAGLEGTAADGDAFFGGGGEDSGGELAAASFGREEEAAVEPEQRPGLRLPSKAPAASASDRSAERAARRAAKAEAASEAARRKAELELLMLEEGAAGAQGEGFDMQALRRATKLSKLKGRARTKAARRQREEAKELLAKDAERFQVDTQDSRFQAVLDRPEFAVDPTHPQYKETPAMLDIQQKRQAASRRRRERQRAKVLANTSAGGDAAAAAGGGAGAGKGAAGKKDMEHLLASVKRKAQRTAQAKGGASASKQGWAAAAAGGKTRRGGKKKGRRQGSKAKST